MRTFLAAAASTLLLAACSSGGGDSPQTTTGSFRVVNASSVSFDEVYVAPTDDTSWGAILNTGPVLAGGSFTVAQLVPGVWDVEIVNYGVYSPYFAWGWNWTVAAGATTQVSFDDNTFTGSLRVYNDDVYLADLTAMYVVPHDWTGGWGANQLDGWIIEPAGFYTLWAMSPDYYDVLCEFDDGSVSEVEYDVPVSPLTTTFLSCDAVSNNAKLSPVGAELRAAKAEALTGRVGARYAPPAAEVAP
jgi:hypothetical protein